MAFVVSCNGEQPTNVTRPVVLPNEEEMVLSDTHITLDFDAEQKWQLDFNGDGLLDNVSLLSAASVNNSKFRDAKKLDLWENKTKHTAPATTGTMQKLLLLTLSKGENVTPSVFVLFSAGFVSFLNSVSAQDIKVIKQQSLAEYTDNNKGDGLSVLTEAGIDSYIFWNGKIFEFYEPDELP